MQRTAVSPAISSNELRRQLDCCPPGVPGWQEFERLGLATLVYLFVPPLRPPHIQPRTLAGVERRDAVFPNRERNPATNWGLLHADHGARMILVEFKNYDKTDIGPEEINQTSAYMRPPWGRMAIVCCNKKPSGEAYRRRNTIYSTDGGKLILFMTSADLKEMLDIKDRGEDPSDFIVDSVEYFYLQHD
jgi:hypothetical protein